MSSPKPALFQIPAFTDTVSVNVDDFAAAIRADLDLYDKSTNIAAYAAIRNGLRLMWVRDNGTRGDLTKFIKLVARRNQCERTLYRHLEVAQKFAEDSGLLDKKTRQLTNGKQAAPILETQLELFSDPKAKFDGAMKKLVKWVGERGLTDLYSQITKLKAKKTAKTTAPPVEISKTLEDEKAEAKDELSVWINGMDSWFLAEHHTRITAADRALTQTALEMALKKIKEVRA